MKKNKKQREVLLVTSSAFMHKELREKEPFTQESFFERLENACRKGMLKEWSWGLIPGSNNPQKSFLQKIFIADRILCAYISERPATVDTYYSIDPYFFLQARLKNKS